MPLTFQDFRLSAARAVVHIPGGQVSPPRLIVALLNKWGDIFNGEPASFPSPKSVELPADFPRLYLTSEDREFRLQIAGNSAEFMWVRQDDRPEYTLSRFVERAHLVLTHFLEVAPASAGRLAFHVQRNALDDDPARTLIQHFCSSRWLDSALKREDDFAIHAHKIYEMDPEFQVNSWVKCRTKRPVNDDSDDSDEDEKDEQETLEKLAAPTPYVLLEQEISTLEEIAADVQYDSAQILHFLTKASVEVDHIGAMYFPEE